MSDSWIIPGQPGPPYARLVPGGDSVWRRFFLHLAVRLSTRKQLRAGADVEGLRARQSRIDRRLSHVHREAQRTNVDCAGVPAEWIEVPETRPERVLLYLHGGAFASRFPETHAGLVAPWCRRLGARALLPHYRLAPEHPYPAAPEDCQAAYRWLLAQGVAPTSVAIAGDSAGGTSRSQRSTGFTRLARRRPPAPSCCRQPSISP